MRRRLLAALLLVACVASPGALAQQTCRAGGMEFPCGWTEPPPADSERELAWYERGDVQLGLTLLGFAGSVGAGVFAVVRTRQRRRGLADLLHAADSTYAGAKAAPDAGIPRLVSLRIEVRERHARGRIEDAQYLHLDQRITSYIVRLRLLELDRRFPSLPAPFLAEVRRLVGDGMVSSAEADLVAAHAREFGVPEPSRTEVVALVRSWATEDGGLGPLATAPASA